jgi:hypothetical protein
MLVTFGGKTYEVTLFADTTMTKVKVVGGQTLKSGTNNWIRALRMALRMRSKR